MKATRIILSIFLIGLIITSCNTPKKTTGSQDQPKITKPIGGKAGKLIDVYMNKQIENLMSVLENAKIEKEKERIKITFESGLLFALNSADLGILAKANITRFATVLENCPDTKLLIEGHTDNTGDSAFNDQLSADRAKSVAAFLNSKGISQSRIISVGYGSSKPKAENSTAANRALNRRVEVVIYASDKLIKDAKSGKLNK